MQKSKKKSKLQNALPFVAAGALVAAGAISGDAFIGDEVTASFSDTTADSIAQESCFVNYHDRGEVFEGVDLINDTFYTNCADEWYFTEFDLRDEAWLESFIDKVNDNPDILIDRYAVKTNSGMKLGTGIGIIGSSCLLIGYYSGKLDSSRK